MVAPIHQVLLCRFHRLPGPLRLSHSRDYGPRLRKRIDLHFRAQVGAERRSIVEESAEIPVAIPARFLGCCRQERCTFAPGRAKTGGAIAVLHILFGDTSECIEDRREEPGEPNTLAAALHADLVHSVVPIACPDERKMVTSE